MKLDLSHTQSYCITNIKNFQVGLHIYSRVTFALHDVNPSLLARVQLVVLGPQSDY